jgi:hypothetical protein
MFSESSHGLVHLRSPYTVSETIARLEGIVSSKRLTVLARIDHSGDAARVGVGDESDRAAHLWKFEGWYTSDGRLAYSSHRSSTQSTRLERCGWERTALLQQPGIPGVKRL